MSSFDRKWATPRKEPYTTRLKETLRPPTALKARLGHTQRALQAHVAKLDAKAIHLREKDRQIFTQVTAAVGRHDLPQASALSTELSDVRKMTRIATQSKMVLEQIQLRLTTVTTLGDLAVSLTPAVTVLHGIKTALTGILPEADHDLTEIGNLLTGLITDAGHLAGTTLTFEAGSEDAEKILAEAAAIAEQRVKDRLPGLPTSGDPEPALPSA